MCMRQHETDCMTSRQTVWHGDRLYQRSQGNKITDSRHKFHMQDVHATDSLTSKDCVQDKARIRTKLWDRLSDCRTDCLITRLSDFETECKEGVKTTFSLQDSRHKFHMPAGSAWDRLPKREEYTRAQPSTFAASLWGFYHCEVCPKAGPAK